MALHGETGGWEKKVIRGVSRDEQGQKRVEKAEVETNNPDTLHYVEDKGMQRMDRHPVDGRGIGQPSAKSGRGGKFTWDGPRGMLEAELDPIPAAVDEGDPNYQDEGEGDDDDGGVIVGEVEVAKMAEGRDAVTTTNLVA